MGYFAGLAVSVNATAICNLDGEGNIVAETSVPTEPAALGSDLWGYADRLVRIGHETGALTPWLHRGFAGTGLCHGVPRCPPCACEPGA
jgi:hypothetical protein